MKISLNDAAEFLRGAEDILILSHQFPDGDTLGSAAALCFALQRMGKRATTLCSDRLSTKYAFLYEGMDHPEFEPKTIVSVDVADAELLGQPVRAQFAHRVDLSIDHHAQHTEFAKATYVDGKAAATTEIIYELLIKLGVKIDARIAAGIYTGITTDTGCFKYPNATPRTYRIAASMMETGINAASINRQMFDTKTRARLEMERMVMDSLGFYFDSRCAIIYITRAMINQSDAKEDDLEGLASMPRQVEGVLVGVTIREKKNGDYKISLRTEPPMDAALICVQFGGGGHENAAGCTMAGSLDQTRSAILSALEDAFLQMDKKA